MIVVIAILMGGFLFAVVLGFGLGYFVRGGQLKDLQRDLAIARGDIVVPHPEYPACVSLNGTALCLNDIEDGVAVYFRPSGAWEVRAEWIDGKLMTRDKDEDWYEDALALGANFSSFDHLRNVELIEITEEELQADNN